MSTLDADVRGPYVGSMMRTTVNWIMDRIYDHVVAAGFDDLGRAHVRLFRHPTAEGLRPSELADRMQVTKQAVNDVLHDLEARGYLVRQPDPDDGKARWCDSPIADGRSRMRRTRARRRRSG